jgi:hypothetical protein
LSSKELTSLDRRVAQLEAQREGLPSVLIHGDPTRARLDPQFAAALDRAGKHVIVLPVGRSAVDYGGGDDAAALVARNRKYFIE